jgi:hypothetical protein
MKKYQRGWLINLKLHLLGAALGAAHQVKN